MAEETKAAAAEEVKNCPACKKPMKKARRYYRNGSYYHNKNCFNKARAEAAPKEEKPKATVEAPKE